MFSLNTELFFQVLKVILDVEKNAQNTVFFFFPLHQTKIGDLFKKNHNSENR